MSTTASTMSPPSEPSAKRSMLILTSMMLSLIPVALDQSILSPAQIIIQTDLHSHDQFSWVVSIYLITQTAFSLVWGQLLAVFDCKWCYVLCILLFALGSLVAGVAGSMTTLIVGRAIAGIGGAGIFISILTILAHTTSVAERARSMGLLGLVFGFSIVVGPLLGGALSEYATWRWCFYINLPVGGIACLAAVLLINSGDHQRQQHLTRFSWLKHWTSRLASIDLVGLLLVLVFQLTLTIPLQSVGVNNLRWSSARIIVPLCLTPLTALLLMAWSRYLGAQRCLFPLDLLSSDRNLVGCSLVAFATFWSLLIVTYYLALQYQVVRNVDATLSGVQLLPLMVSMITMVTGGGFVIKAWARYYPLMVAAPVFGAVGIGLLSTVSTNTSEALLAASQVLVGLGIGPLIQNPVLAAQANTADPNNISRATGAVSFFQRLGGAFAVPAARAVLDATFQTHLTCNHMSNDDCQSLQTDPLELIHLSLHQDAKTEALSAFVKALRSVYLCALPFSILSFVALLLLVSDTRLHTPPPPQTSSETSDKSTQNSIA